MISEIAWASANPATWSGVKLAKSVLKKLLWTSFTSSRKFANSKDHTSWTFQQEHQLSRSRTAYLWACHHFRRIRHFWFEDGLWALKLSRRGQERWITWADCIIVKVLQLAFFPILKTCLVDQAWAWPKSLTALWAEGYESLSLIKWTI